MPRKRLLWHIFPSHVLLTLTALAAVSIYTANLLNDFSMDAVSKDLEARAYLMEDAVRANSSDPEKIQDLIERLAEKSATRVTLIRPSGSIVADSEKSPEKMDNHANRPEIAAAMIGKTGHAIRFSQTLQRNLLYVAIPIIDDAELIAVLRTALPLRRIRATFWSKRYEFFWAIIIIALIGITASWFVARTITKPLQELKEGAERLAQGDFGHSLHIKGSEEIESLARAMNTMATQLEARIRTIIEQRNQQDAVLSSMIEGVIAVDTEASVISINQSASQMLCVDLDQAQGKSMESLVRNTVLQRFVNRALSSDKPIEEECVLHKRGEQVLQIHGAVLRDGYGNSLGAVIVLNDVTRLRKLEQVRQHFVANVSHELRTPITSIKGFVETLLDGALEKPEDTRRFLEIVAKQSNRLMAILEDLLTLSRSEAGTAENSIPLEAENLRTLIEAAVTLCKLKATQKGVHLKVECPDALQIRMNAPLLEQAVSNLIDNAVKYSEAKQTVVIKVEQKEAMVRLLVKDQGAGIPAKHLPRLFERFYRVDKSRSRSLGGTGLGLSIVKHISNAHGGTVHVQSTPGHGSTFSIHLPLESSETS